MDEGSDESLRRRVETLSKKNEAKDSARNGPACGGSGNGGGKEEFSNLVLMASFSLWI